MKKSVFINLLILVSIIFLLCGCDSYRAFMSIESGTAKSWSQSHDYLDGRKSHILRLGTESQNMVIEVVTEKGSVDITAVDSFGETIIFLDDAETGTYEFEASGKVKITVEASGHKGSVSVKNADS